MARSPETKARRIVDGFSLEITAKDVEELRSAQDLIPSETRINVTYLASETAESRAYAARLALQLGFRPVPHIAARRLPSLDALEGYLALLADAGAAESVCVIGGDPARAEGPFESALDVIRSGVLSAHGVREVSVAGYPEGHPGIPDESLRTHLVSKIAAIEGQGMRADIATQFSFDATKTAAWVAAVRADGLRVPLRIGVPGPANVKRLLAYARRFGIGANAMIVRKYGFSLTNLVGAAGPDRFVSDLASALAAQPDSGKVNLHLYSFGGLRPTAQWARAYVAAA